MFKSFDFGLRIQMFAFSSFPCEQKPKPQRYRSVLKWKRIHVTGALVLCSVGLCYYSLSNQVVCEVVGEVGKGKAEKRGACRNCRGFRVLNDPK